jgi:hypothetical protein
MKKLLRDFLRLRNAGHALLRDRRAVQPRHWMITVPAPRDQPAHTRAIDMHWQLDPAVARPVAHWHRHHAPLGAGA